MLSSAYDLFTALLAAAACGLFLLLLAKPISIYPNVRLGALLELTVIGVASIVPALVVAYLPQLVPNFGQDTFLQAGILAWTVLTFARGGAILAVLCGTKRRTNPWFVGSTALGSILAMAAVLFFLLVGSIDRPDLLLRIACLLAPSVVTAAFAVAFVESSAPATLHDLNSGLSNAQKLALGGVFASILGVLIYTTNKAKHTEPAFGAPIILGHEGVFQGDSMTLSIALGQSVPLILNQPARITFEAEHATGGPVALKIRAVGQNVDRGELDPDSLFGDDQRWVSIPLGNPRRALLHKSG